jgi:hypothetical protein
MSLAYPGYRSTPTTSNITIGGGGAGSTHTISISGAGASHNSVLTSTGTGTTWANNTNAKMTAKGQLHLEGENADIVMNGVSLKDILNGITDRLAILQPKSELLEKYANLREAYEHYKTLEALLHEDNNGQ